MTGSMFLRTKQVVSLTALLLIAALVGTAVLSAAGASIAHPRIVSANPADFTPNVQDDAVVANAAVYALNQSGSTMYAGGTFRTVRNAARTATYTRYNLMAFDATTGAMRSFAPVLNAPVWGIATSGTAVYVAGEFTTVNGVARRALVKLNGSTGAVDPTFNAAFPSGKADEVRLVGGRLLVSGSFPKRLVALNPATGADTGYVNVAISGSVASNAGPTEVYRFAVNPAGTRLVGIGNFTSVGGQSRWRAFMLNLGATSATVNAWNYPPLRNMCASPNLPDYLKDVDFSPDGSYFVFVSTGYVPATTAEIGTAICDAAARFETNVAAPSKPTWINYTGGDTLYSVAATGAAVYVQGHQRWLDNPYGRDFAGPGAVSRRGIGAINPTTGKALSWNPGKDQEVGGKDFFATAAGLWVGSDGRYFAGEVPPGSRLLPALVPQLRSRSVVTPSPVRSSSAALRPVIASTRAIAGPLASGPVPWRQLASVARSVTPAIRSFAPMSRLLFL